SLGSGGRSISKQLHHFLNNADLIFGIGCSFTSTNYGVAMPKGKRIAHATLDPLDINKDIVADIALAGDAALTLDALIGEVKNRLKGKPRGRMAAVTKEISTLKQEWLAQWMPRLTQKTSPLSPYRVLWDLMHTVGLAMGAKLANPEKLCVNFWGDAAIGFTGMDFETAVRERIPILSVLSNNFSMAIELKIMQTATKKYRSTDISVNYAEFAKALGGYGERVSQPDDIVPAIRRAVAKTREGVPALLEFITEKAEDFSMFA